jgi:uncharacterized protein YqjF (DUF2071 family)
MQLLTMRWQHLLFAHWPLDAGLLSPLVPRGLELDLHDGMAWLGVVPFGNARLRPLGLALPGAAISFGEVNVRTYVRGPDGVPAVWFLSLDGDHLAGAVAARAMFSIPYHRATVTLKTSAAGAHLRMHRVGERPAAVDVRYRPTGPVVPASPLDTFLTDRLVMFGRRGQTLLRAEVRHAPWRLRAAEAEFTTLEATAGLGLPPLVGAPHLRWAEPLDVEFPRLPSRVSAVT